MSRNNNKKEKNMDFYRAVLSLKDLDECCGFFEDICAATELQAMEQRFEVAKMLKNDEVYMEITRQTNASSATISRVNRMMTSGTGVLPEVLDRIEPKEEKKS